MKEHNTPFFHLGDLLRKLRKAGERSHEDVSGAVEIDVEHLRSIEQGVNRPSEETLLMLIQHLKASEEQAERLWELAGYAGDPDIDDFVANGFEEQDSLHNADIPEGIKNLPNVISMGISVADPRIVYTDMAKVEINDFGVVMNFHQLGAAPDAKPLAVAKVGMSREHAEKVIKIMQTTIKQYDAQRQKNLQSGTHNATNPTTKKSASQKSQEKNQ